MPWLQGCLICFLLKTNLLLLFSRFLYSYKIEFDRIPVSHRCRYCHIIYRLDMGVCNGISNSTLNFHCEKLIGNWCFVCFHVVGRNDISLLCSFFDIYYMCRLVLIILFSILQRHSPIFGGKKISIKKKITYLIFLGLVLYVYLHVIVCLDLFNYNVLCQT